MPMTWTLEPFCFDGAFGFYWSSFTQKQLGGTLAPFTKVRYPASALPRDCQAGADETKRLANNGNIKDGDTVLGFSLGSQVVALYLSQNTPPKGVRFVLCGWTFWRNQECLDKGNARLFGTGGVPWNTANEVIFVARQGDGFSDQPDIKGANGFSLAQKMAAAGQNVLHHYETARLDHPANVVTARGNITAVLVPTCTLPAVKESDRRTIDGAFSRPSPTTAQLAQAVDVQVK